MRRKKPKRGSEAEAQAQAGQALAVGEAHGVGVGAASLRRHEVKRVVVLGVAVVHADEGIFRGRNLGAETVAVAVELVAAVDPGGLIGALVVDGVEARPHRTDPAVQQTAVAEHVAEPQAAAVAAALLGGEVAAAAAGHPLVIPAEVGRVGVHFDADVDLVEGVAVAAEEGAVEARIGKVAGEGNRGGALVLMGAGQLGAQRVVADAGASVQAVQLGRRARRGRRTLLAEAPAEADAEHAFAVVEAFRHARAGIDGDQVGRLVIVVAGVAVIGANEQVARGGDFQAERDAGAGLVVLLVEGAAGGRELVLGEVGVEIGFHHAQLAIQQAAVEQVAGAQADAVAGVLPDVFGGRVGLVLVVVQLGVAVAAVDLYAEVPVVDLGAPAAEQPVAGAEAAHGGGVGAFARAAQAAGGRGQSTVPELAAEVEAGEHALRARRFGGAGLALGDDGVVAAARRGVADADHRLVLAVLAGEVVRIAVDDAQVRAQVHRRLHVVA